MRWTRCKRPTLEQTPGYGMDDYCDQARLIRKLCDAPDAGVHFFVGATQANFYRGGCPVKTLAGVLGCRQRHINVVTKPARWKHRPQVLPCPACRANYRPAGEGCLRRSLGRCQPRAHCPARHGISTPLRTAPCTPREELDRPSATCYDCGLCLFVDGARMAYGLAIAKPMT